MTVNCAASAMWLLPDTVVRKHCSPARSQQAAASAEAAGDTVLVSTHSVPARAMAASCAATLSSAASPGNDEKTMSTPGSASCASITLRPRSTICGVSKCAFRPAHSSSLDSSPQVMASARRKAAFWRGVKRSALSNSSKASTSSSTTPRACAFTERWLPQ